MQLHDDGLLHWLTAMHTAGEKKVGAQQDYESALCFLPAVGGAHVITLPHHCRVTDARARRMATDACAEAGMMTGVFFLDGDRLPRICMVNLPVEGLSGPGGAHPGGTPALVTTGVNRTGEARRLISVMERAPGGVVLLRSEPAPRRLDSTDPLAAWLAAILPPTTQNTQIQE